MSLSDFLDHDDVTTLVKKLEEASNEYYNNSNSIMTDAEFDSLKDKLADADPDHPFLKKVGASLPASSAWDKRKHNIPMASLNKCNLSSEFLAWTKNHKEQYYLVEDKNDGISIDLEYNNGNIFAATTRGDGLIGQDILKNVLNMQNVKKKLDMKFTGNIRGEIVMTKTDFAELCKHEDLKNRRNSAAGIATRHDGTYSDYLTILYYDIIEEGEDFKFEHDKMFRIKQLGLNTSEYTPCASVDEVIEVMNKHIESLREKKNFDIDGLVVKLNNIEYQESMGYTPEGNPKGQIAWKFPNECATTTLKDIEWSMGKGGAVTPVAIFEPTLVAGAILSRASLGSYGEFKRLKLHEGDKIEISRRNDVIPKVEKVIKASNNPVFIAPKNCPNCGKALKIGDKRIACTNKLCTSLGLGDLMTWIKALDIKGMGPAIIEGLFEENTKTPVDFYKNFEKNTVMSEKVTKKITEQLNEKKELPLDVFIDGLNIENFGGSTTRSLISQGYDSLEKIMSLTKKQLESVDGVGDIKAEQIISGLKAKRPLIEQLISVGVTVKQTEKKKEGTQTVLFTGSMVRGGRKEMSAIAKSNGFEVVERVSKDLSMLVVPDKSWSSSKTQAAKKQGIKIITEEEFNKLLSI